MFVFRTAPLYIEERMRTCSTMQSIQCTPSTKAPSSEGKDDKDSINYAHPGVNTGSMGSCKGGTYSTLTSEFSSPAHLERSVELERLSHHQQLLINASSKLTEYQLNLNTAQDSSSFVISCLKKWIKNPLGKIKLGICGVCVRSFVPLKILFGVVSHILSIILVGCILLTNIRHTLPYLPSIVPSSFNFNTSKFNYLSGSSLRSASSDALPLDKILRYLAECHFLQNNLHRDSAGVQKEEIQYQFKSDDDTQGGNTISTIPSADSPPPLPQLSPRSDYVLDIFLIGGLVFYMYCCTIFAGYRLRPQVSEENLLKMNYLTSNILIGSTYLLGDLAPTYFSKGNSVMKGAESSS